LKIRGVVVGVPQTKFDTGIYRKGGWLRTPVG